MYSKYHKFGKMPDNLKREISFVIYGPREFRCEIKREERSL